MRRRRLRKHRLMQKAPVQASVAPSESETAVASPEAEAHELIQMQRRYGNRHTQAYIASLPPGGPRAAVVQRENGDDAAAQEKRKYQSAMYGVNWMLWNGASSARVPKQVPAEYHDAVKALNVALVNHQSGAIEDVPEARAAVHKRYAELELYGLYLLALHEDELVLREQIQRQNKAVNAWRVAYPAIQQLFAGAQAAGVSPDAVASAGATASPRTKISNLHSSIIEKLPALVVKSGELPEELEVVESYFKVKEIVPKLETYLETSKTYLARAEDALKAHKAALAGDGFEPGPLEAKAATAIATLKTLTSSPKAFSDAIKKYKADNKIAGAVGVTVVIKDLLSDVALPITKYGVGVTENVIKARQIANRAKPMLERADDMISTTARFTKLKAGLQAFEEGLGTVAAVVDVVGGIVELSEGINDNSLDAMAGGTLGITSGMVTLIGGASLGTITAPFIAWTKLLVHVVGEVVKAFGAMHIADMKSDLQDVVLRAQSAGESANQFLIAAAQRDAMAANSSDNVVDQDLLQEYEATAVLKAASTIRSTHRFVEQMLTGKLGGYANIRQSFDQGVGGAGEGMRVLEKLDGLAGQAEDLQGKSNAADDLIQLGHGMGALMPGIFAGVKYVSETVQGFDADNQGPVRFLSPEQSTDSLELKATWKEGDEQPNVWWNMSDFSVKSPIYHKGYHQAVYDRHKGKNLAAIAGIPVNIKVSVIGSSMMLHFSEGSYSNATFPEADGVAYAAMAYRKIMGTQGNSDNKTAANDLGNYLGNFLLNVPLPQEAKLNKG